MQDYIRQKVLDISKYIKKIKGTGTWFGVVG